MLREEIKKITHRKQFLIVFIIFFAAAIVDFLITCKNYYGIELSWVRSAYKCGILTNEIGMFTNQFFGTLFPLLVCVAVSDVFCPVSGVVAEVNEELLDAPQLINEQPYEAWMIKVENVSGSEELLSAAEYEAFIAQGE